MGWGRWPGPVSLRVAGAGAGGGPPITETAHLGPVHPDQRYQTTPYISMKALERMPVKSISAPNRMGSTKPPSHRPDRRCR